MKRRSVLGLAVVALAAPARLFAQQPGRVYRIGILLYTTPTAEQTKASPFRQGLAQLGWVEGKNIVIEERSADGKPERLPGLAAELVGLKVDVIVTVLNSAVLAARNASQSIPVVAFGMNDPIKLGFAQSYARPGGNVTGLTFEVGLTIDSKTFELLKEAVPSAARIALLARAQTHKIIHRPYLDGIPPVAKALKVELLILELSAPEEFPGAFARMREARVDALFVPGDPLFMTHRAAIAELAIKQRLPMGGPSERFAEAGGVIGFGYDIAYNLRRAADYVDKILRGANPAELPIEQPSRFQLAVNLKTARALGLTLPQALLLRADRVIE